jgi:hypothetical protein
MVKIYKYFHIYADTDIEVLRFCGEADTQYKMVPQHDNSRVTSGDRKAYRIVWACVISQSEYMTVTFNLFQSYSSNHGCYFCTAGW